MRYKIFRSDFPGVLCMKLLILQLKATGHQGIFQQKVKLNGMWDTRTPLIEQNQLV